MTLTPSYDGEYAIAEMTGSQVKELVQMGFGREGDGEPLPYLLVTRENQELEEDQTYRVAFLMGGYTEQTAQTYGLWTKPGSLRAFLRDWLEEQKTVSPDGNPWR